MMQMQCNEMTVLTVSINLHAQLLVKFEGLPVTSWHQVKTVQTQQAGPLVL